MPNLSSTLWVDNKTFDLETVKQLLLSPHPDDISEMSLSCTNWTVQQVFEEDNKEVFNGKETIYNCFKFSYDQYFA